MSDPVLYGARISVYTRIAALALREKGVAYRPERVNPFDAGADNEAHRRRHPFGKIPVLTHDGITLYETAAITQYVDEAFEGPPLQPAEPLDRARMRQVIGICDSYAFRNLVFDLYVAQADARRQGQEPDPAALDAALERSVTVADALADLLSGRPYFGGDGISLADLHALPMVAYARCAPEGLRLIGDRPALAGWWQRLADRDSVRATRFRTEPPASGAAEKAG